MHLRATESEAGHRVKAAAAMARPLVDTFKCTTITHATVAVYPAADMTTRTKLQSRTSHGILCGHMPMMVAASTIAEVQI
jgi:hypothetical protein